MTRERIRGGTGLLARFAAGLLAVFLTGTVAADAPRSLLLLAYIWPLGILIVVILVTALAGCARGGVGMLSAAAGAAGFPLAVPLIAMPLHDLRTFDGGGPLTVGGILFGCALTIIISIELGRLCGDIEDVPVRRRYRWPQYGEADPQDAVPRDAVPQDAPSWRE